MGCDSGHAACYEGNNKVLCFFNFVWCAFVPESDLFTDPVLMSLLISQNSVLM